MAAAAAADVAAAPGAVEDGAMAGAGAAALLCQRSGRSPGGSAAPQSGSEGGSGDERSVMGLCQVAIVMGEEGAAMFDGADSQEQARHEGRLLARGRIRRVGGQAGRARWRLLTRDC